MPPSALQNMLTEGDTGAPFFSDRDGSEEPVEYILLDEDCFYPDPIPLKWCLRLLVSRADALGHRTVSVENLRELLQS